MKCENVLTRNVGLLREIILLENIVLRDGSWGERMYVVNQRKSEATYGHQTHQHLVVVLLVVCVDDNCCGDFILVITK